MKKFGPLRPSSFDYLLSIGRVTVGVLLVLLGAQVASAEELGDQRRSPASNVPPHIVLYLQDRGSAFEQVSPSITARGMTFHRLIASTTEISLGHQVFLAGSIPGKESQDKTMADYLKLKGYRLLTIGEHPFEGERNFQFEDALPSLIASRSGVTWQTPSDRLSRYLAKEIARDHRPVCLIIYESEIGKSIKGSIGLEETFAAVREALPNENTLFIATAICGQAVSDRDPVWSEASLRMPLTVVWDGHVQPGGVNESLISSVDLMPTLIELVGGTPPSEIDGRSFAGLLRGESHEHRDVVYSVLVHPGQPATYCVRDSRLKCVAGEVSESPSRIFDLLSDPDEQRNLVGEPAYESRAAELHDQLKLWLQRHGIVSR
jgi:hypothetical protein